MIQLFRGLHHLGPWTRDWLDLGLEMDRADFFEARTAHGPGPLTQ